MNCDECGKELGADRTKWCEHANARFEAAWKLWDEKFGPMREAVRRSQLLTADDYSIRINCIAD